MMDSYEFDKSSFFRDLQYFPHKGQQALHNSPARHRILACASRWGKTTTASKEIMAAMFRKPGIYWCIAPTYDLSKIIFNQVLWGWLNFKPEFVAKYSESERYIRLINGSECWAKSSDNPESLLGRGIQGMVIDEAASMREHIWQEFLQPRLTDTKGWVMFTSTPKGRNWYWQIYKRGKDPDQQEYWSMEGPVWDNPTIDHEWVMTQRTNYTERFWQQEVLGMFVEDSGSVFRNVRNHIGGELEKYTHPEQYSIGVDLAKHQDWTAITVLKKNINGSAQLVHFDRFNQVDWPLQKARIDGVSKAYRNAPIYIDSSGIGDPITDDLKHAGLPIVAIPTAQQKTALIDALSVGLDNSMITYPDIPVLLNELEIFDYEMSKTGRVSYHAPENFHDDCVISLALAWHGITHLYRPKLTGIRK